MTKTSGLTDWKDLTAENYMDIEYMKLAYNDQAYLKEVMMAIFNAEIFLEKINENLDCNTIAYPEFINIIENNIESLTASGNLPLNMQPSRQWFGEFNDVFSFSYKDVNRWFESFKKINDMILGSAHRILKTGTFASSDDRGRQLLRV